jgi:hypothetical protein
MPGRGADPAAGDGAAGWRGREEIARDPARGAGAASARERARARVLDRARSRDAMADWRRCLSLVGCPVRCVWSRGGRGEEEVERMS